MTRKNSFDFIRLLAAVGVVFSHSFALTGHPEPGIGTTTLGTISVWIFFILSGYLIAKSWDQYPRLSVFLTKRALRIFPGLIVAIVLTILVCGLFFSTIPPHQYLVHQETLAYLNNILLLNPFYTLPGVFTHNIFPGAVNGSIWTLGYEFSMYLLVALFGIFNLFKKISAFKVWILLFVAVAVISLVGKEHFSVTIFYLNIQQWLVFALMFFSGIVMHKYEKKIKLSTLYGLATLILFIGVSLLLPVITPLLASSLLAYSIFSIGKTEKLSWWSTKFGDLSYGVYIYAFPIQQMIITTTNTQSSYKLFIFSTIIILGISALSWHFIESKALRLKDKINLKMHPLTQSDESW